MTNICSIYQIDRETLFARYETAIANKTASDLHGRPYAQELVDCEYLQGAIEALIDHVTPPFDAGDTVQVTGEATSRISGTGIGVVQRTYYSKMKWFVTFAQGSTLRYPAEDFVKVEQKAAAA